MGSSLACALVFLAVPTAHGVQHTAKCGPKVSRPITATKTAAYEVAAAKGWSEPCVLLQRPFDGGNIGSTARAMLNFGLSKLRVVDPADDVQGEQAVLRATGAAPVLRHAETFESLPEATADLQLVLATTARPRDCLVPVYEPRAAAALAAETIARGERVGFLFGSEKNGLTNEELLCAHALVTIPTNPGFSSLNLGQAVLLMCYEWANRPAGEAGGPPSLAAAAEGEDSGSDADAAAPLGMVQSLFSWWEGVLWDVGFFGAGRGVHSAAGPTEGGKQEELRATATMDKIRRMVLRARPSRAEVSLLRGSLQTIRTPKATAPAATPASGRHDAGAEGGVDSNST